MKKFIALTLLICISLPLFAHNGKYISSPFAADKQAGDKIAFVMVHFGTTHADTRVKTIEALNERVKTTFPEWDFYEAYTSRIIIGKLKKAGMEKSTPAEVFRRLIEKGYKYVMVQASHIIDGIEMESLRKEIATVKSQFKDIRMGNCLLYSPEDYIKVAEVLNKEISTHKEVVAVGHGTYTPATATYAMLDYVFKEKGLKNFHVGTVEGYPGIEQVLAHVQANGKKEVLLIPLMFVAGEHAKNDIQVEWKELFEEKGYDTTTLLKGLGEYNGILDIFIAHIRFATQHKEYDIMEKKANYAKENN